MQSGERWGGVKKGVSVSRERERGDGVEGLVSAGSSTRFDRLSCKLDIAGRSLHSEGGKRRLR